MSDRAIDTILNNYYNNYCEDNRFSTRANRIEFITTIKYIDKYLKEGDRLLEIGAGTGAYSLHYASKGYCVDAVELIQSNVDIINDKKEDSDKLNIVQANALDLSMYKDNSFDVTLLLGPLYHLFDEREVKKAIEEALRVTKVNGKLFFAFVLVDSTLLRWGFEKKNIYENVGVNKMISTDYKPSNSEEQVFNVRFFEDIKTLLNAFDMKILHYVATDGIGPIVHEILDTMSEKEYNMFIEYHLSSCEREDLIGYSAHMLAICQK